MSSLRFVGVGVLLAALLAGCGAPSGPVVGAKAPDLEVESFKEKGKFVKLSSLEGKVVLLDFWATWCGPCREAMPMVESLYRDYKDKGFEVMAISNEFRGDVEPFKATSPNTYPVYLDTDNSAWTAYEVTTIPDFVLIGKDGTIVYRGAPDREAIESIIKKQLGG